MIYRHKSILTTKKSTEIENSEKWKKKEIKTNNMLFILHVLTLKTYKINYKSKNAKKKIET